MGVGLALAVLAVFVLAVFAGCAENQLSRGLFDDTSGLEQTLATRGDIGLEPPVPWLRQLVLPSGLRVGFEAAPTRGMVAVVLVVGQGSTSDPPGKEGLAHLIEHLVFRASFEKRAISETLARLGATYNADTVLDRTLFYAFAPKASMPSLLRIVGQLLDRPLAGVSADDFTVERQIVENELRQRNETAVYGQVAAWMQSALFPADHPYARPVGGTVETLRRLTLADAQAQILRGRYAPRGSTLVVVGDFDPTPVVSDIDHYLPRGLVGDRAHPIAPLGDSGLARPAYLPPAPPAGHSVMKAPVAWPEVWLTYFLADMYGPYAPAMKVLTTEVVERTLRDGLIEDPDVIGVELERSSFRQATVLACRITLVNDHRRQEIADRARALMASLWQGQPAPGTDPNLLWQAPRLALADAILETEPFTARAVARAEFFHVTGALNAFDALIGTVAGLSPQEVAYHGARLLGADRARVLFVEPLSDAQRPAPGAVGIPSVANRPLGDAPIRGADFGEPAVAVPIEELRNARRVTLRNGLNVVLVRRPQFPAVTAILGFRGGTGAAPPGVVELLRLLERDGTFESRQNALQIQKADGPDLTADMVVAGRRNLSNALLMLAGRLRALDHLRWGRILHRIESTPVSEHESPAKKASRAFWRALYGDHPYARVMSAAELHGLTVDQMEWLPHIYNPRNATLVLAGDLDVFAAEALVTRWFSNWTGDDQAGPADVPAVPPPIAGPPHETVLVTHRPITNQVELAVGCRLPAHSDLADVARARMLAGVVAGQLRSRLREEGGAAYSVSGSASVLLGGGAHLIVGANLDARRLAEALRVVRGYWRHFARGEFDPGTLSQVRWELVASENLGFQTAAETALRVLEASNRSWPVAGLVDLPALYQHIGADDLGRLFATCRSNTVISLLGDEATIRAALDSAAQAQVAAARR